MGPTPVRSTNTTELFVVSGPIAVGRIPLLIAIGGFLQRVSGFFFRVEGAEAHIIGAARTMLDSLVLQTPPPLVVSIAHTSS